MTRTRRSPANPHGIPVELPADGTPFTVVTTTTHQKKMGDSPMSQDAIPQRIDVKDFENANWNVYIQTAEGFQFIDKLAGRPYDPDIRDIFGTGRFKSVPIGPEGKPLEEFAVYHKIMDVTSTEKTEPKSKEQTAADWGMQGAVEMPAWMRMQLQQATEEKRESRRRQEASEVKEQEWKREQQAKEWERKNREEGLIREQRKADATERKDRLEREMQEKRDRADREREERRFRTEQQNNLMKLGAGLFTAFIESRGNSKESPNLNSQLLSAVITSNRSQQPQPGLKDQIDILLALDKLRGGDKPEDKEESDFMKMMGMASNVVPALASMRGGGTQPQQAAQLSPPSPEEIGLQVLNNPEAISQLSMSNPAGIAQSLVTAVKGNPALKDAVVKQFQEQGM